MAMSNGNDATERGYSTRLKNWLSDIMYGKESHEWAVVVEE